MEIDLIQTQFIRLSRLEPNDGQVEGLPKNPRKITAEDLQKLKDSITKHPDFLALRELVVYPHGDKFVVLGGNMRLRAMRQLKFKEAPCKVVPVETPIADIKTFAALDNGSFGSWDYDALANEWDDLPLVDLGIPAWEDQQPDLAAPVDAQEDDFDETQDEIHVRCAKGDVWQLGDHRLMCGDSTDAGQVSLLMNGENADLLLTDPPYGTTRLEWDIKIDLGKMWEQIQSFSKSNAASLIFGTQPFVTDLINSNRDMFRYDIIWKKTMRTGFFDAKKRPLRIHEIISVFYESQPTYNPQMLTKEDIGNSKIGRRRGNSNIMKTNGGFVGKVGKEKAETYFYEETRQRYPTDVIEFSNWNGAAFGNTDNAVMHPTQKPVDMIGFLISSYSDKGNLVLDLFGGSGTTLIAAEQLGRKCYMMELDPHYCDVIIARWEKLTGKKATKIN